MNNVLLVLLGLTFTAANRTVLQDFNSSNKLFTAAIYKQLAVKNDDNFLLAPISAEVVLGLIQSGAKDDTGDEIRRALNFPNSTEKVESLFRRVLPVLKSSTFYTIYTANKIYIRENYAIREEFKKIANSVYKAAVENINFSEKDKATDTINDWVDKRTKSTIHNLITQSSINDDTVAILINALYFKGEWRTIFKHRLTEKSPFYATPEKMITVDMMSRTSFCDYHESSELDAKFLKLSFKGSKKVHMVVVLPNQMDGLRAIEKRIKKVFAVSNFTLENVNVKLPKFRIETSVDFKTILQNLGVKKAFSHADFSGIAGEPGDIEISEVIQKTFISVNENGVEAASATAASFHSKSLLQFLRKEKSFIADHPFLFYIKIKNVIVFVGRVISPNSS